MDSILGLALAASMISKCIVDLLRLAFDSPRWVPPLLAVGVGIAAVVLLMVASSQPLTAAALASAVLAGILAGGSAVGVTELSNRAATLQAQRNELTDDAAGAPYHG